MAAVLCVITAGLLAAACGGDRAALTIYSGRGENLVGPLLKQFAASSGIDINVRYGNSADLALLLAEEDDRTPADVFFSQSPGAVGFLAREGLLEPIDESVLSTVDPRLRDESGLWVGVTGRQRVLVYNRDLVDPSKLPASVFKLTEAQYRGRVAVAPENASFQDFVTAMRMLEGEEAARAWLCAMDANDAQLYANNNSIVAAVSRGEVEMGLVNHYYNFRFLAEDPQLPSRNHVFRGDVGALLIVSATTVIAGTDHRDEAQQFIKFLLSEEAQSYFAKETFEYPLVPDVAPAADLPPLASLDVPDYDIEQLGGNLRQTATLIAECGLVR